MTASIRERKLRREVRSGARMRRVAFPRLVVYRSNANTSAQLIDDHAHKTLVGISSHNLSEALRKKNKTEQAFQVGVMIAAKAKELKVAQAVFDRRSYRYHGRVKAVAEGARSAGLKI